MIRPLEDSLSSCTLCPRRCGADRLHGEIGICGAGSDLHIHHWMSHAGEEPPLSGPQGSGTIFFSGCPLRCVYCQNHKWSQTTPLSGSIYSIEDLATLCMSLQDAGCHNINFVTPEPWIPFIVPAVNHAKASGLSIPIVWNTSGFISYDGFELLQDTVDIYLTDIRYKDPDESLRLSGHRTYFSISREMAVNMLNSVGHFRMNSNGIGIRGLIVRVLILPGMVNSVLDCLDFIARELSLNTYISIMAQFEPVHLAHKDPTLRRRITQKELRIVRMYADSLGLKYGWRQDLDPSAHELLGTSMEEC